MHRNALIVSLERTESKRDLHISNLTAFQLPLSSSTMRGLGKLHSNRYKHIHNSSRRLN